MLSLTEVLVALVALIFSAFFFKSYKNKNNYCLPAGPRGLPILGHIPFLGSNPAETFLKWKQIYGPIFTVRFGSIQTVVLNDAKLIKEALNLPEFSGRPLLPVFVQCSQRQGITFSDGQANVEQRRFTIKTLKYFGVGSSLAELRQQEEIAQLLHVVKSKIQELDGKPMEMNKLFRCAVINSLWGSVMGGRFKENDPTLVNLIRMIETAANSNGLIDLFFWFFPWVAKVGNIFNYNPPTQAFKGVYKYMEKEIAKLKPFCVKGEPKHFTDAYFDKVAETTDFRSSFHESKKMQQAITTSDLFMASIDTAINTMDWLMIYMAKDPEVQRKLQDEIDNVIGLDKSRLPSLTNRRHMPYTNALIEELLRITSIAPLSIYHRTLEDVQFQGYKLPKNTMIIPNLFAAHYDPEIWENPENFDPQRFLDTHGQFRKCEKNEILPFSFGKRACAGEGFARDTLFLLVTSFFREFTVSNTDKIPSLDRNFGVILYPNPFELYVNGR